MSDRPKFVAGVTWPRGEDVTAERWYYDDGARREHHVRVFRVSDNVTIAQVAFSVRRYARRRKAKR